MVNVVVLNGGRGAATLIPALLDQPGLRVTSIVNAYDDGKSTGAIRHVFNMLGPSDLRKVQSLMLAEGDPHAAALFAYRYPNGADRRVLTDLATFATGGDRIAGIGPLGPRLAAPLRRWVGLFLAALPVNEAVLGRPLALSDCALMNILYAGAFLASGRDMEATVLAVDRLFRLRGLVLPNSGDNRWLAAEREDGEILPCEADIVELRSNARIRRLFLLERPVERAALFALPHAAQLTWLEAHHTPVRASAGVRLAIEAADIIVYAAGTQHSSLYPTYLSRGIAAAIAANRRALKAFVTNIGADYETPRYTTSDFLRGAHRFLCLSDGHDYRHEDLFSLALINSSRRKADETYVEDDAAAFADLPVRRRVDDFESAASPGKHDGAKLVAAMLADWDALTLEPPEAQA